MKRGLRHATMALLGQGGSIPLCNVFAETYPDAELILMGVEEPLALIHAPNESVRPERDRARGAGRGALPAAVRRGTDMTASDAPAARAAATGVVLLTLASGQFLMTLDSSVMNVSIAQVAEDVGTTVTGIQTAITLYTLVMATLMITGGKIGTHDRAPQGVRDRLVIYGCGSLTTALAPNLTVLIIGWSFLEGIGAALIMPAIVGLVASNFPPAERPRAYGLVASAGAIAVAAGPLIGGACTTYLTWRVVFAGEVVIVLVILVLTRKIQDTAARVAGPSSTWSERCCPPPASASPCSACSARASGAGCTPKPDAPTSPASR